MVRTTFSFPFVTAGRHNGSPENTHLTDRNNNVVRNDRVESRGLRPVTLPHHRTCGFPHPAVRYIGLTENL